MSPWRRKRGGIGLTRRDLAYHVGIKDVGIKVDGGDALLRASNLADDAGGASEPARCAGHWDAQGLQAALLQVFAAEPSVRAWTLAMAPDAAVPFTLRAPDGVRSVGELQQLGQLIAARLFGEAPHHWAVAADWQLRGASLCSAAPAAWVAAAHHAARQAGCALQVVAATDLSYVQLWERGGRHHGCLAWPMPGFLMLAMASEGVLQGLRCLRMPGHPEPAAWAAVAAAELAREAVLEGRHAGTLTFAWPGAETGSAAASPTGEESPMQWLDARGVLPVLPALGAAAAAWSARIAFEGAA